MSSGDGNGGDGDSGQNYDISTANTMRERADESRVMLWLLMSANRFAVTFVFALFVFAGCIAVSVVMEPSLPTRIQNTSIIFYLFSSMIGVVVTGTTFVVTISQLVISEENGPLGDQRKRMSDAMDVRTYASELFDEPTPADPSAFLRALVAAVERRTEAVYRLVGDDDSDALRGQVEEFAESVHGNAQEVERELEGEQFGTFKVVHAALNFNYSWKIYHVDRMLAEFDDELDDAQTAAFEDLKTALTMFGPVREHIKTLYFQWALIDLSRYILYVAIPALVVAGVMLIFGGNLSIPGATFDVPNVTWLVSGAFTFTSLPFLLFAAYIFRVITVAKRTLAIGPLILRSSQR